MSQYLSDPEYLFSILTALVKKYGGKIKISEEEMKMAEEKKSMWTINYYKYKNKK